MDSGKESRSHRLAVVQEYHDVDDGEGFSLLAQGVSSKILTRRLNDTTHAPTSDAPITAAPRTKLASGQKLRPLYPAVVEKGTSSRSHHPAREDGYDVGVVIGANGADDTGPQKAIKNVNVKITDEIPDYIKNEQWYAAMAKEINQMVTGHEDSPTAAGENHEPELPAEEQAKETTNLSKSPARPKSAGIFQAQVRPLQPRVPRPGSALIRLPSASLLVDDQET